MKKLQVIKPSIFLIINILSIANVSAETLENCMKREALAASPSIEKVIFTDAGCNTEKTDLDGERHSCSETLCWSTPPNHIVVDSSAVSASSHGSEYSFSSPSYEPTRDAATKVCYTVKARSPQGLGHEKGWQKINATAKIKKIPDSGDWVNYARSCLKAGAS